jgi:hypothetical protein
VSYSFLVSKKKPPTYRWRLADKWSHCDSLCKGKYRGKLKKHCFIVAGEEVTTTFNPISREKNQFPQPIQVRGLFIYHSGQHFPPVGG